MAFGESDATKPFDDEIARLQRYAGEPTSLTSAGQLQLRELQSSRYDDLAKARKGIESDIRTSGSLSKLMGSTGFEEDIMRREAGDLGAASDRAIAGTYERMADSARADDYGFQDKRAFESSRNMAALESGRADALNRFRISEYQKDQQSTGVGGIIGGAIGAIAGAFAGNPMMGYSIGSQAGGYAEDAFS